MSSRSSYPPTLVGAIFSCSVVGEEKGVDNWRPKSYVVWEAANGPVPEGHVLIFLDGNGLNCDLSNIMCVSNDVFREIVGNGKNRPKCYGLGKTTEAYAEVLKTKKVIEEMSGVKKEKFKWNAGGGKQ